MVVGMVDKATKIAREALEVPGKGARFIDEVAAMVKVGCCMIMAID